MGARESGRPSGTRERLARISHHFLDTSAPAPQPAPALLPVLLDAETQDLLVYGLAQTCHARGTITRVLHIEPRLRAADSRSSPLYELLAPAALMHQLEDELSGTKRPPDLCLIPLLDDAAPVLAQYSHAVMLVPATPAATVHAYLRFKRLLGANPAVQLGVVMLSGGGEHDTGALFDKLTAAARRFLDRAPILLGRLSGDERCRIPHGMLELAETLSRRGFAASPREPEPEPSDTLPRAAATR